MIPTLAWHICIISTPMAPLSCVKEYVNVRDKWIFPVKIAKINAYLFCLYD